MTLLDWMTRTAPPAPRLRYVVDLPAVGTDDAVSAIRHAASMALATATPGTLRYEALRALSKGVVEEVPR